MSNPLLYIVPIHFREACAFIAKNHRHHRPPQGYKFAVSVHADAQLVGVATCGRPVSRVLDDHFTLEVTHVCTDGMMNACGMLCGDCPMAAKALSYRRLITYILSSEPGTSLKAVGWRGLGPAGGGDWNCPSRPRHTQAPTTPKVKYGIHF